MTINVFPSNLPGIEWNITKAPRFATIIQRTASGKEIRSGLMSYPLWEFSLSYSVLRSGGGLTEMQTLAGFFLQQLGQMIAFNYSDPSDNSVTAQIFGSGDGATTAFQLLRTLGGFNEPIQNLNGAPNVFVNGTQIASLATPASGALGSVAGGTIAATTYYVRTTYVDVNGGETLASVETSLAVALDYLLTVASPAAETGAVGWNVYVSTATGTETKQNATAIAIGTAWTEPTTGLVAGAGMPAANNTGFTIGVTGIVTFAKAPAASASLTWSGNFYYLVRFTTDIANFKEFMQNLWDLKSLTFQSVKQ